VKRWSVWVTVAGWAAPRMAGYLYARGHADAQRQAVDLVRSKMRSFGWKCHVELAPVGVAQKVEVAG
jgi:hypothetical protein